MTPFLACGDPWSIPNLVADGVLDRATLVLGIGAHLFAIDACDSSDSAHSSFAQNGDEVTVTRSSDSPDTQPSTLTFDISEASGASGAPATDATTITRIP